MVFFDIVTTVVFVVIITMILMYVENKSNLPSALIIPILVALLTKYVLGDWDRGFQWTALDIVYWMSILGISYGVVYWMQRGDL